MSRRKRILLYLSATVWGLLVAALVLYMFFPYQKAMGIVVENVLGNSRIVFSLDGVKMGSTGMEASKAVIGHKALEGRPLLEVSHVRIGWSPFSLLRGRLTVASRSSAYGGVIDASIRDIPVVTSDKTTMFITFRDVNLAMYPEGRFPWFKGLKGIASGWIKREVVPGQPESQKGAFHIEIIGGEINELHIKDVQRLILPFKKIAADGTLRGSTIDIKRIFVDGPGVTMEGSGTIDPGESDQRLAIQLAYQATSQSSPFPGKGIVSVTGNQWAPQIALSGGSQ